MAKDLNVCMIGYRFMGRAHSNAYLKVGKFFDVPLNPWSRDRWPGVSSSGSGVAAAAGSK